MLIRRRQIDAFDRVPAGFEFELADHIAHSTPWHAQELGEAGTRHVARLGLERASRYGFTQRATVRLFVEMMFMLGSDFDTDPQFPWLRRLLVDAAVQDEVVRADHLWEDMMSFVQATVGAEAVLTRHALQRMRAESFYGPSASAPGFPDDAIQRLRSLYPERCDFADTDTLHSVVASGITIANHYKVSSGAGTLLFIVLTFMLGHGFARDAQFPWIETILHDESAPQPEHRAERLFRKSMAYIDGVLRHSRPA